MQKAQEKLRTAKACKTVVACENSPHNVTVSGKAEDMLNQHFGKAGISCQYVSSCRVEESHSIHFLPAQSFSMYVRRLCYHKVWDRQIHMQGPERLQAEENPR